MADQKFVKVGGVRTGYLKAGSGETAVLFHGDDFCWMDNVDYANKFREPLLANEPKPLRTRENLFWVNAAFLSDDQGLQLSGDAA